MRFNKAVAILKSALDLTGSWGNGERHRHSCCSVLLGRL